METRSGDNKLKGFFLNVVRQSFWQLGINDAMVANYVADVLTEFARTDNLYRIRSQRGRKVDSVVEMLAASADEPADQDAILTERSRRKYVGDYALFMSGIFRNYITRTRLPQLLHRRGKPLLLDRLGARRITLPHRVHSFSGTLKEVRILFRSAGLHPQGILRRGSGRRSLRRISPPNRWLGQGQYKAELTALTPRSTIAAPLSFLK